MLRFGTLCRRVTSGSFTHVQSGRTDRPSMVGISSKGVTQRVAVAEVVLSGGGLPCPSTEHVRSMTAAARSAAVGTYKAIPFCHPLDPLEVSLAVHSYTPDALVLRVTAATAGKTGVEMEALSGAAFAGVCFVNEMRGRECADGAVQLPGISRVSLVSKSGGKSGDVFFDENANRISQ